MFRMTILVIMCWLNLWCHAPYSHQMSSAYEERVRVGDKTITYLDGRPLKTPEYMVGREKSLPDLSWYLVH